MADRDAEFLGHTTFGTSRDPDGGPHVGEVRAFFVSPAAWRQGVGRALMAGALVGLAEMGFVQATVWSFADNVRANAFYAAHGFTPDGTQRRQEQWAEILEGRWRRDLP